MSTSYINYLNSEKFDFLPNYQKVDKNFKI